MSDTEHDIQPIMDAVMEAEEEQPVVQLTKKGRVKKPVSEAKKKHLENARALRKRLYDKSKEALKKLESLTARGIDIEDLIKQMDEKKSEVINDTIKPKKKDKKRKETPPSSESESEPEVKSKKHKKKKKESIPSSSDSDSEQQQSILTHFEGIYIVGLIC